MQQQYRSSESQQIKIRLPKNWDQNAQISWVKNERQKAIQEVIQALNQHPSDARPADLFLQIGYYLYLTGDRIAAAGFLEKGYQQHQNNQEIIKNLAVSLTGSGQYEKAKRYWDLYIESAPQDYLAYDSLTMCYFRSNELEKAKETGTYALYLKDCKHGKIVHQLHLPTPSPQLYLKASQQNIISFSLWGSNPRYLRGAIDNALARFYIYPDWVMRFYVDDSVPQEVCETLEKLGGQLIYEVSGQTIKQKLAWRFKVANDPTVGRFLVRDIDSVVNTREKRAVEEWIKSNYWFHIMRDWWSHTDLILAGMWGGIANILPTLDAMLANYTPQAMETPNIDQWFLRDEVWCYVKQSCLIHDRFFAGNGHQVWLSDRWQEKTAWHVGQDVHAVEPHLQAQRLQFWMNTLNSLK